MKKIFIVLISVIMLVACSGTKKEEQPLKEETPDSTPTPTAIIEEKELVEIYKDNEIINEFLNKFNEANSDYQITSDMLTKYYHHGSEHDDQIKFTLDDVPILITSSGFGIEIIIDNPTYENEDELKRISYLFIKAYNQEINNDTFEVDWSKFKNSLTLDYEKDGIEYHAAQKNIDTKVVLLLKLTLKGL